MWCEAVSYRWEDVIGIRDRLKHESVVLFLTWSWVITSLYMLTYTGIHNLFHRVILRIKRGNR